MQRQKLGPWGYGYARKELVSIIFTLLDDGLPFDLLELPQQDQAGDHVRWYDVQVPEEVGEQSRDVGEGIAVSVRRSRATEQETAALLPAVLVSPQDFSGRG